MREVRANMKVNQVKHISGFEANRLVDLVSCFLLYVKSHIGLVMINLIKKIKVKR